MAKHSSLAITLEAGDSSIKCFSFKSGMIIRRHNIKPGSAKRLTKLANELRCKPGWFLSAWYNPNTGKIGWALFRPSNPSHPSPSLQEK